MRPGRREPALVLMVHKAFRDNEDMRPFDSYSPTENQEYGSSRIGHLSPPPHYSNGWSGAHFPPRCLGISGRPCTPVCLPRRTLVAQERPHTPLVYNYDCASGAVHKTDRDSVRPAEVDGDQKYRRPNRIMEIGADPPSFREVGSAVRMAYCVRLNIGISQISDLCGEATFSPSLSPVAAFSSHNHMKLPAPTLTSSGHLSGAISRDCLIA